jgi:translation initiation factor 2B subunit (eIF-2B alpha/beta/delta family)
MNLDALVAPLRADVVSGAAVVARAAAAALRRGAVHLPADDPSELRAGLEELGVRVLDAQPAMAPLVELVGRVLDAAAEGSTLESIRRAAAAAAESFRGELESRGGRVAQRLARGIPKGARVMTLSSSSTVRTGLLEAQRRDISVVCLEGRPINEGQALARTLAQAGIPVTLAVDAAAQSLVREADLVIMGADSLGDGGIVNKIGSVGLARGAREHGVPVWVAADRSKWLPPGFPQPVHDDRPADEVWRGARGVTVWNRYFELFPASLVDRIVTDSGSYTPAELDEARRALRVAPALEEWARRV